MLNFDENVKCKDCGDSVECRLCSVVIGSITSAKVFSCEKIDVAENLRRARSISEKELRRNEKINVKLNQLKLF